MATIQGPTGGKGTRAIATRWPVTEGIIGGTTKQKTTSPWLEPEGIDGLKSTVPCRDKAQI